MNRGLPCRDLVVSADGNEILWSEQIGNHVRSVILRVRRVDGVWSDVETAPFSGNPDWKDLEPSLAPTADASSSYRTDRRKRTAPSPT